MVAYSFQREFVDPIRVGLCKGPTIPWDRSGDPPPPKRQTIRAVGKKRHARTGEEIQLYCNLRTVHAFMIGRARCTNVLPIVLHLADIHPRVYIGGSPYSRKLDEFAREDGFEDWKALRLFWDVHHPHVMDFHGLIIYWAPL